MTNKISKQARMIQVLSTQHLGAKKSLAVVQVAGEAMLIGITDNNISMIKSISLLDDDMPQKKFSATLAQKIQSEEEFSMKGIKDIVSQKLKNMKEIGG
jgi:flagellar protein FliO/FliZ